MRLYSKWICHVPALHRHGSNNPRQDDGHHGIFGFTSLCQHCPHITQRDLQYCVVAFHCHTICHHNGHQLIVLSMYNLVYTYTVQSVHYCVIVLCRFVSKVTAVI